VQAFDGLGIDGLFCADQERELGHERTQGAKDEKQKWRPDLMSAVSSSQNPGDAHGLGVS
jgi:hypothetical protein